MQKGTVKNVCAPPPQKNREHLNFKTQDDKMIHFPMCEKLAMNNLLPFKSSS